MDEILYTIYQGDCLNIDIEPLDDEGAPFEFTGATVEVGLEWGPDSNWSDDTDGGVEIVAGDDTPGVLSVIKAKIPASVTADLPTWRDPVLQVRLTDSNGCVQTILAGRLKVKQNGFSS